MYYNPSPPTHMIPILLTFYRDLTSQKQLYRMSLPSNSKIMNLNTIFRQKIKLEASQGLFFFLEKKLLGVGTTLGELEAKAKKEEKWKEEKGIEMVVTTVEKF